MKKSLITPVLFIIFLLYAMQFTACKSDEKKKVETVDRFSWMNGYWEMKEKDGIVTEQWKRVNDSLMEGKSDFVKGDSVIPFETIRMFRSGNDFYYEAKAAGQNNEQPVAFKLTSFSDTAFVAETRNMIFQDGSVIHWLMRIPFMHLSMADHSKPRKGLIFIIQERNEIQS